MSRNAERKNLKIILKAVNSMMKGMKVRLFAEGLACSNKVLLAWATACCDTEKSRAKFGGDSAVGSIAATRRLRFADSRTNAF